MQNKLLNWICCPLCKSELNLENPSVQNNEIYSGELSCNKCNIKFPIVNGIPYLLDPEFFQNEKSSAHLTSQKYEFLWKRKDKTYKKQLYHAERVISLFGEEVFKGKIGIDAGAGMGEDSLFLAKKYPKTNIISIDLSSGVDVIKKRAENENYKNIHVIRTSILQLPIKDKVTDFAYSYGVLHHTTDPKKGFLELSRILKKNGNIVLYLYEDHRENLIKYFGIKIISFIRKISIKIPPKITYLLCTALSPVIIITLTLPAKLLRQFNATKNISDKIPFNFGKGLFSVRADLYDRFSAPLEFRFSKEEIKKWYEDEQLKNIQITKYKDIAGIFSYGTKCKK